MESTHSAEIAVIGIWHLGLVTSACLADLGFSVTGVDTDAQRLERLSRGEPPIQEPGLETLLLAGLRTGHLRFSSDLAGDTAQATHVILAIDTPIDDDDEPALAPIDAAFASIIPALTNGVTIIVSSQVPAGTCDRLDQTIRSQRPDLRFGLACVPENLRLGQAIDRFLHPDMIVIGTEDDVTRSAVDVLYTGIEAPRVYVDRRSAEMIKHAINAYLATSISFANEMANLCDISGADAVRVMEGLRLDRRVSPQAPLRPGMGFSGGTLARDMKALQSMAERAGYEALLIGGVIASNSLQNTAILRAVEQYFASWNGLRIALLGLTYKPGTSTVRRSAAIEMLKELSSKAASVSAYDPMADPNEVAPYAHLFTRRASPYEAAAGSHALIVATPWPEFANLDLARLRDIVAVPLILDPSGSISPQAATDAGFVHIGAGTRRGLVFQGSASSVAAPDEG
jgi:UDPglucose 6-dehydrogenase